MFLRIIQRKVKLSSLTSTLHSHFVQAPRYICDRAILKLDAHEIERKRFSNRIKDIDAFWLRLLDNQEEGLTFEEDLKAAWFLIEEQYMPMLIQMTEKYIREGKSTFGSYSFPPVMIRTCLLLNKPDTAMELLKNPTISKGFNEATTIITLLDLFIETGYYSEAVFVYEWLERLEWFYILRHPLVPTLTSIALYKQGTPEALVKATQLAQNLIFRNRYMMHINCIIAGLALKLKELDTVISIVGQRTKPSNLAWNLKMQAYILKEQIGLVDHEISEMKNHKLYTDTVDLLQKSHPRIARSLQSRTIKITIEGDILAPLKYEDYKFFIPATKKRFHM